jgi:hypothetical protein
MLIRSVFEQEIQDFPGVREEKKKGEAESVEKTRILEITTLSRDYFRKMASFNISSRSIFQKGVEDSQKNSEELLDEFASENAQKF